MTIPVRISLECGFAPRRPTVVNGAGQRMLISRRMAGPVQVISSLCPIHNETMRTAPWARFSHLGQLFTDLSDCSAFGTIQFRNGIGTEFGNAMRDTVLIVFPRTQRTLNHDVSSLRQCFCILGEFAECDNAMPFGTALPVAGGIFPGFFGCDRQRRHGCTVGREVKIGVLTGESDNGELIQIHVCVFSSELISICLQCLGAPKGRTPPAPKRDGVLVGGTGFDGFGGTGKAERRRVQGAGPD
jgi:hypothetical protein